MPKSKRFSAHILALKHCEINKESSKNYSFDWEYLVRCQLLYQIRLVHPFLASVDNLTPSPSMRGNKGVIETDLVLVSVVLGNRNSTVVCGRPLSHKQLM